MSLEAFCHSLGTQEIDYYLWYSAFGWALRKNLIIQQLLDNPKNHTIIKKILKKVFLCKSSDLFLEDLFAATVGDWLGQSQESGSFSRSHVASGAHAVVPSSMTFPGSQHGAGLEMLQLGLKPAPIRHACSTGNSFIAVPRHWSPSSDLFMISKVVYFSEHWTLSSYLSISRH